MIDVYLWTWCWRSIYLYGNHSGTVYFAGNHPLFQLVLTAANPEAVAISRRLSFIQANRCTGRQPLTPLTNFSSDRYPFDISREIRACSDLFVG